MRKTNAVVIEISTRAKLSLGNPEAAAQLFGRQPNINWSEQPRSAYKRRCNLHVCAGILHGQTPALPLNELVANAAKEAVSSPKQVKSFKLIFKHQRDSLRDLLTVSNCILHDLQQFMMVRVRKFAQAISGREDEAEYDIEATDTQLGLICQMYPSLRTA